MPQQTSLCSALETKLEIAEKALSYSNENIALTIQIWMGASPDTEDLLAQRADIREQITLLIRRLREQSQSDEERELLDSATPRGSFNADHEEHSHPIADGQSLLESGDATANVLLPLLVDNASLKAFVEFLRAQLHAGEIPEEAKKEMAGRAHEIVRQNQVLKSVVAERKRLEERLSQLESIIQLANDAIAIYTLGGTIVSWNKGAEAVYGYREREVLGRSRYILVPPHEPDEIPEIIERLKREEKIGLFEAVHVRKGGERIPVSISVSPVKDATGAVVGVAAITRCTTGHKQTSHS